jgi:hypothetical protein
MPARMLMVRFFAKTYGWTERQCLEETSLEAWEWLPKIEQGAARAIELERKRAERQARSARHAR